MRIPPYVLAPIITVVGIGVYQAASTYFGINLAETHGMLAMLVHNSICAFIGVGLTICIYSEQIEIADFNRKMEEYEKIKEEIPDLEERIAKLKEQGPNW